MSHGAYTAAPAADLFGGDNAEDPFASLGVPEPEAPSDPSSGFFDQSQDLTSQYGEGKGVQSTVWSSSGTEQRTEQQLEDYENDQGWYDDDNVWHSYDEELTTTSTTTSAPALPPTENEARRAGTDSYALYASPANSYAPTAPVTTRTPSSTFNASPMISFTTPSITPASTYEPYKPNIVAAVTKPSQPGFHSRSGSYGFDRANVPVVSAAPTVIERPTVYNAYDPPMPPPKPSKRTASRPSRITSPTIGQTYPGMDAYSQLSPPGSFGGSYTAGSPSATSPLLGNSRPSLPPGPPPRSPNVWPSSSNPVSVGLPPPPARLPSGAGLPSNGLPPLSSIGPPPAGLPPPPVRRPSTTYTPGIPPARLPPGPPRMTAIPPPPPRVAAQAPQSPPRVPALPAIADVYDPEDMMDPEGLAPEAEDVTHAFEDFPTPRPGMEEGFTAAAPSTEDTLLKAAAITLPVSEVGDFDVNRDNMFSPPPPAHAPPPRPSSSASSAPPPAKKGSYRSSSPMAHGGRSWPGSTSQGGQLVSAYSPMPRTGSPLRHERSISPAPSNESAVDPSAPTTNGVRKEIMSPPSINAWSNSVVAGAPVPARQPPPQLPPTNSYAPSTGNGSAYAPKKPATGYGVPSRSTSPEKSIVPRRQPPPPLPANDPYAPKQSSSYGRPSDIRTRSMSNSSAVSNASVDPYGPSGYSHGHASRQASESSDYGDHSTSRYNYSEPAAFASGSYDSGLAQEIPAATHTQYAPSPSLMGLNDPLGRASARIPVITFGFGGKVVTCFHGASFTLTAGFDVALSSRQSTDLHIRSLHMLLPDAVLDSSTAVFPGPLFSDPGTPTTGLVRTGVAAQLKTKKAKVVKYLEERAEEISRGIGYSYAGTIERRQAEGKLALVSLLKVMVDHDGQITGSPAIDTAVRAALVPRLGSASSVSSQESGHGYPSDSASVGFSSMGLPVTSSESPIAVTTLRASSLDRIQDFLLRGERQKAYHYALDEKLWAHAMVIASSIDKDSWKEVVNEFLKTELGAQTIAMGPPSQVVSALPTNGREGLRVAYRFYSGQGAASVQELLPHNPLARIGSLQVPMAAPTSHVTPMSPNFPAPAMTAGIPAESLSKWPETAAMILSNPFTPDSSSALTALGDYLISNSWTEAAHACYLLSPQTSPMGTAGSPSTRVVLVGTKSPHSNPSFWKDSDAVIFTEIVEFAHSLATPVKGQDTFGGLPHLQAYKLLRAATLAEQGHVQMARRYTDAITASLGRNSPAITATFMEQLKGLSDRLIAAPHLDKSGWGSKMSKPSLDSIGTWIGGRFEKLITGDGDALPSTSEELNISDEPPPSSGPFSRYSTISSTTNSAATSPTSSVLNLNILPPPRRPGSAVSHHSAAYPPIDRASSAMDYVRRKAASPAPRVASASAATTTFAQAPSYGQHGYSGHSPYGQTNGLKPSSEAEGSSNGQDATWWGNSSYAEEDASGQTPTAMSFQRSEDTAVPDSSSGFISLMDDVSYSPSTTSPSLSRAPSHQVDDDEEDLGFGNSKRNTPKPEGEDEGKGNKPVTKDAPNAAAAQTRPELNSPPAGSWISRWWKKSDTPGPIKASLGEETSFVFDKDLKRWVNKKANGEIVAPPTPLPPPSRSQTASPGRAAGHAPSALPTGPPSRPSSAMDLTSAPPPRQITKVRSSLAPTPENDMPPPPPSRPSSSASISRAPSVGPEGMPPPSPMSPIGAMGVTPPPSRPRSQASKRNIRSRYVDVLQ